MIDAGNFYIGDYESMQKRREEQKKADKYLANLVCGNCDKSASFEIPKGMSIKSFSLLVSGGTCGAPSPEEEIEECYYCGCSAWYKVKDV